MALFVSRSTPKVILFATLIIFIESRLKLMTEMFDFKI